MSSQNITKNSELLPCPFCGGEAQIIESDYGMYLTGYAVYCKGECHAKLGVSGRLGEAYEWIPVFDTEAEAIAVWNTRAERIYATGGIIAQAECRDVCASISEFTCSSCGFNCDLTSWISLFDGDSGRHRHHHHGTPNYCPNCGAKVVGE